MRRLKTTSLMTSQTEELGNQWKPSEPLPHLSDKGSTVSHRVEQGSRNSWTIHALLKRQISEGGVDSHQ